MASNAYQIKKGKILTDNGLPFAPRWFCDGRLAVQVDNMGLADINYFGANSDKYIAFHKRFRNGMQFFIKNEKGTNLLKPGACEILPFGFNSDSEKCAFSLFLANETIYFIIEPKEIIDFSLEFYDDYRFYPDTSEHRDVRYGGAPREWSEFTFLNNILSVSYTSQDRKTNIAFSSNAVMTYNKSKKGGKHILSAKALQKGEEFVLAIHFSNGANNDFAKYKEDIATQFKRYETVANRTPVLHSSHKVLNQFFELAPMYHESLKTIDVKGAIRAQSTHYWVWGWDSMTSNNCSLYWGDHAFIGDMLSFMETYSDGSGIAHAFSTNMQNGDAAAPPAQGMYLCLMDLYRLSGGDISKHYSFAKRLFDMILATEVGEIGLCKGYSLYPDHRDLIHETGQDISSFNNTVSYCSVCSMEKIAKSMGDMDTAEKARAFAERMETNFCNMMYNPKFNFFDASVEATTFEKRDVASNNSIKWENNYCEHLISGVAKECLNFYENHLVCKAGIRPHPEWDDCYDADSNQLHCWWPVMSEFYIRLINRFDRPKLMNQYIGWVEYWTERLMCPEGIDCYCDDPNVPFDNWNAMPGIWHAYSVRGFYNAIVHGFIGIDFDENGINFYPYSGEEVSVEQLHWGEKTFSVSMRGSGPLILDVVLNGVSLGSVKTIPYKLLARENEIFVYRMS